MRKAKFLLLSFIGILSILSFKCFFQNSWQKTITNSLDKNVLIQNLTYLVISDAHYKDVVFDDSLSARIFEHYLNMLDFQKIFFLESDYQKFKKYEFKIDDQIKSNSLDFFELTYKTYKNRLKQAKRIFEQVIEQPFDFSKKEYLNIDMQKINYAKDTVQLKEYWRKFLKYQTLIKVYTELQRQKKDTTSEKKSIEQIEQEARKEVKEIFEDYFERLLQKNKDDIFNIYMAAITTAIDPHTIYMAPKINEDFQIWTSGELEGIGATLQQKNGKIKIISIVPGGPAWKQGELEPGDYILKVAQGKKGSWINVVGMPLEDAVRLIRGKKGTIVRLMIEKPDGTIKEISIVRDKIIIEETYIKSIIILDTIHNFKIGYIYFPSFYFSSDRSVSKDLLKELKKLKKDTVSTIIIDLRNNSGGALNEVVRCVSYFIGNQPVVQVRDKNGYVEQLKENSKIKFDGNLLIMTNYNTASASEIFAGAMQDYHKALIFGTSHTHGKGTVQTIIDYDQTFNVPPIFKPLGTLKLTIAKYYRVSGNSTQLKGVVPDIIYPSPFQYLKVGEIELDYPMNWDKIEPAKYKPFKFNFNVDSVIQRSQKRLKNDSLANLIIKYAKFLKIDKDSNLLPLNLQAYEQYQKKIKSYTRPINKLKRKPNNLKFVFTSTDQKLIDKDTVVKIRYQSWLKTLKRDKQLKEAFNICVDMNLFAIKNN